MEVDPPNTSQAETSEVGTSGIDTKALCEVSSLLLCCYCLGTNLQSAKCRPRCSRFA